MLNVIMLTVFPADCCFVECLFVECCVFIVMLAECDLSWVYFILPVMLGVCYVEYKVFCQMSFIMSVMRSLYSEYFAECLLC
jgi:hypothetical protein